MTTRSGASASDPRPLRIQVHPDVRLQIEGYVRADEVPERLAEQIAYAQRLRRELSETAEEVVALRHETQGLRQRLRAAERNLSSAMSGDHERFIQTEVQRRLDSLMREKPRRHDT